MRSALRLLSSVLLGIVLGSFAAPALADPSFATLGEVKVDGRTVSGVLTFHSPNVVDLDGASVQATVDGVPARIGVHPATHIKRTAALVIDTSGSMGPTGMGIVRSATADYLAQAPADVAVGVVSFAQSARVDLRPTTDRTSVQKVVGGLKSVGGTSLYQAVRTAVGILGSTGDRSIVLLSDGGDTASKTPAQDLAQVTAQLRSAGIRVDVVRFNNDDPVAGRALAQFAGAGGGSNVAAGDQKSVSAAFRNSARSLASQVPITVEVPDSVHGQRTLTITGSAAGQGFQLTRPVDFGAAPPLPSASSTPAAAVAPAAADGPSRMTPALPWIAAGLTGLGIFGLVYAALTGGVRSAKEARLAAIETYATPLKRSAARAAVNRSATERIVAAAEKLMHRLSSTENTMLLIQRADLPFRAGEWLVLRGCAVVIGAALGAVLLSGPLLLGFVAGGLVGLAGPSVFLRVKAARRAAAFERLLPQALLLAATSLRSGFGLQQALEAVARDAAEPVAKELSRALAETRIGTDLTDALDHTSERMGTDTLRMAVMAIRIQQQVGGNLADTLTTTAGTLREREALRGQVKALSAEGRLSAYILIALPIGLFFYMVGVSYDYVSLLWTTTPGILMSVGAILMLIVGIFWMRRVVQIEV